LRAKTLLRSAFKRVGYDLVRHRPNLHDFLTVRSIDTIIDVGANDGAFAHQARDRGYTGSIISFEPIREVYARLQDGFSNDPLWKGYNLGVSNECGEAVIGVSELSVFSSMHKLKTQASKFDERSRFVRSETIKITTLDALSGEIDGSKILLKLDTQGHEQACLEGIGQLEKRVEGIHMELPLSSLYDNVWSFHEAIGFMKQIGFIPCIFSPVNYHEIDPMAMVEVDCTFRRHIHNYD